jgi:hypothetical protein
MSIAKVFVVANTESSSGKVDLSVMQDDADEDAHEENIAGDSVSRENSDFARCIIGDVIRLAFSKASLQDDSRISYC